MRRFPLELGLVALVLAAHGYTMLAPANSLVNNWFHSDDAFYYFQTARNIVQGHGVTFDGLGRDSGFHPLWMALIVPLFSLARADPVLPLRLVIGLSALLSAGTAALIYRLVRRALGSSGTSSALAALAGLFFAFYPYIHNDVVEMGMESSLSAFCIALLFYRVAGEECAPEEGATGAAGPDRVTRASARRMLVTGLVGALTVLARLDNIFLVGIAGAWLVFRPARLRYLLTGDAAMILLGVLWSYMARVGFGPQYAQSASSALWMCAAALGARVAVYYFFGQYRAPAPGRAGLARHLAKAALASVAGSALLSVLMLGLFTLRVFPAFPRLVLVYEGGFALAAVLLSRLLAALLFPAAKAGGDAFAEEEPLRWLPTLTRAACYFAPVALFLAAYMGWSLWYFGSPMPVSGQVKRWWGTLPNVIYGRPVSDLGGLLGFFPKGGPWGLARQITGWPAALPEALRLVFYGGLAAALLVFRRAWATRVTNDLALFPLFIGSFIQLISYTGTGYIHTRPWYWVSHMLAITLLAAVVVDAGLAALTALRQTAGPRGLAPFRRSLSAWLPRLENGVLAVLCLLVIVHGVVTMVRQIPSTVSQKRATFYLDSTRELEANTEPGARIGSTGGGVIAYFVNDRTIINLDGLMNTNEYFAALQQGTAAQYLDRIGLRYIYTSEYPITSSDPYFQFKGRLEKISAFGGSTLFRWK